ncbi:GDP-6-deoxy-D-mannose reductase [Acidithiobacillus ferrivorans]|uniref:GDP-6-deoxy-D-mannose reductase n=1 Tax=Acidithiobacillus ferrivorans TaxID=160808 RepID=A0A060UX12_9PROT|nr:GDP-mannose 4,6-dehydratase [Acidithiobacillus ferrivorans]CDQ11288.1 GDP-6-deoxy-D-mannose reductase [Acidithiobacillus ferrivorans]SMH67647.1 GDP-6-deoxy-D-mannose reductase [Acidithiobacillus ferrivorans]
MVKHLLTGANGFVGKTMQAALPCVPLPVGLDLRDRAALNAAIAEIQPDMVIHLAAQSFVPASFENPHETFDINFYGTLNLLEALQSNAFKGRMLFVGSGDTYGRVPEDALPVREEHPLHPRNPYAVSKVAAEALCYQWSQTSGFEIVMARPFNHIGPGQSPRFAITDFARQVTEIRLGQRPPVLQVGDIDVTRDFTDVRDVERAYALLLEKGRNGGVYNVCSGREHSIRELLQRLIALAGVVVRIDQIPARLRPAEQRRMVASFEALHRDTGWQPLIPIEQSLQDLLNDWEKQLQ